MTTVLGAPIPPPAPELIPINRPDPMSSADKMRLREAARRATQLYPGPIGQVLSRELMTWEEFGFRICGHSLVWKLVDELLGDAR